MIASDSYDYQIRSMSPTALAIVNGKDFRYRNISNEYI